MQTLSLQSSLMHAVLTLLTKLQVGWGGVGQGIKCQGVENHEQALPCAVIEINIISGSYGTPMNSCSQLKVDEVLKNKIA